VPISNSERPLLSIAIPTYNRCELLSKLLAALGAEITSFAPSERVAARVEVVVHDNASTDDTTAVVEAARSIHPWLIYHRNPVNDGMDGNFRRCFDSTHGRYLWVIGDDDTLRPGALKPVLALLERVRPACLYVASEWLPDVHAERAAAVKETAYRQLDRVAFADAVHVWITFLSGMIVDKTALERRVSRSSDLDRLRGSNLTQLAWVLMALAEGSTFVKVDTGLVLASAGNTGGYAAIRTFGLRFPDILDRYLDELPAVRDAVWRGTRLSFLPNLIWGLRNGRLGAFEAEDPWNELDAVHSRDGFYRWVLRPLGTLPRPAAWLLFTAWRVSRKLAPKRHAGPVSWERS
jgi:glycosyltransferase involved in cell wall biosynthesis